MAAREEITAAKVASCKARERKEAAFSEFHQLVLEPSVKRSRTPSSKEQKHETYATTSQPGRIQYRFHAGFLCNFFCPAILHLPCPLIGVRSISFVKCLGGEVAATVPNLRKRCMNKRKKTADIVSHGDQRGKSRDNFCRHHNNLCRCAQQGSCRRTRQPVYMFIMHCRNQQLHPV